MRSGEATLTRELGVDKAVRTSPTADLRAFADRIEGTLHVDKPLVFRYDSVALCDLMLECRQLLVRVRAGCRSSCRRGCRFGRTGSAGPSVNMGAGSAGPAAGPPVDVGADPVEPGTGPPVDVGTGSAVNGSAVDVGADPAEPGAGPPVDVGADSAGTGAGPINSIPMGSCHPP